MKKWILIVITVITLTAAVGAMVVLFDVSFIRKGARGPEKAPPVLERYRMELVKWFSFTEENSLKEWEEKILKGKVIYRQEQDDSLGVVRATSYKTASALYYKIKLDVKTKNPIIKWKWSVETFPEREEPESLEEKHADDFAARIYVIFPAKFFTHTKVIEYIWAESLPVGETGISPYSKNIRLMVLKSGKLEEGKLYAEERNIVKDFVRLFGEQPRRDIGAIAFMTDADTTGTVADALYADIKLGYEDGETPAEGGTNDGTD
ncbi:MAG: DUF3047 domain-containing protein [Candidatus Omnitrophota bacterium]